MLVSRTGIDTLAMYLASLRKIVDLDVATTLPAHGVTIPRGSDRAHQIILHHRRRLDEIERLTSARSMTGWELMRTLFRPNLNVFQQRLAFGETLAHAHHLVVTGVISEEVIDGVHRYRAFAT